MSEDFELFEEDTYNQPVSKGTFARVVKLGLRHWRLMLLFLFGITVVSITESYFTFLTKRMIDEGILVNDLGQLGRIATQYGLLWFFFAAFVFLFIYAAGYLGHHVQYDLRKMMFGHLQKLQLSYYDRTPSGWIQARVTSDSTRVGDLVSWGFLDVTWSVTNCVAALAFMFVINWRLALIIAALLPIMFIVAVQFRKRILTEYRQVRKTNSKITNAFSQNITGVRVVKALSREAANRRSFGHLTDEMYQAGFRAAWLSALFLPVVQFISAIGVASVVYVGGWQVNSGALTIGGIQAFVAYVTFMLWPIEELARVYASMQQALASSERIFTLLDTEPTIVDTPQAADPGSLRGDIVFDNVSFRYETGKPVLENFDLTVRAGETIALVGPTGAGKSTIVNLVARFYEPTGGAIRIGGHDYRDYTLHGIQSRIGMVLQTPHLFSGTVLENLRYGRLDASDEEVFAAARTAGAHEFIEKLDHAYQTQVGEGGVLLSTGQKQLISLARALLAQPDIFIMDEATSSVDTLTEALIQKGMDLLMTDRTSFVIAHRLSTIKNADRILVLEGGKIAELGTHAELIRARGHYYDLYTRQFRQSALERTFELHAEPALT